MGGFHSRLMKLPLPKTASRQPPASQLLVQNDLFLPASHTEIWVSRPIYSEMWPQSGLETGHLPPLSLTIHLL